MYRLNDKIKNLTSYQPIEEECEVKLDANESYLQLPADILDEIAENIKKIKFNRYPDTLVGNACKAFADYYGIDANFITAGNGSDELISVIINAFLSRGEKLVVTSPDFSMYSFYCKISEVEAVDYGKTFENNFDIDIDKLIGTVKKSGARGLIFSNPCNPTSRGVERKEVIRLIESLPDVLIIIDEAYSDFYQGLSVIDIAANYGNVFVLKTCSKAFGLAAIRLGFAIGCGTLTKALRAVKSPYNVNSLTAVAAETVLKRKDYLKQCAENIIAQRKKLAAMLRQLKNISIIESMANFVYIKAENARAVQEKLRGKGILIRQIDGYLRVNAGSDGEMEKFIGAFKEAL